MDNKQPFLTDFDTINYLKPVYNTGSLGKILVKAEHIHVKQSEEKGTQINDFSFDSIEDIDDSAITFLGTEIFGEPIVVSLPIDLFK